MDTKKVNQVKENLRIIGSDPMLDQAIDTAVQVAGIDLSVLIIGESGTGKEVFSDIIHKNSKRRNGPCLSLNCGAFPEGTIDSELFGHEKGAFTGATSERKGYFEMANGGTIFLDEIGELPLSTQSKLLRVLEKGEYIRVGSSEVRKTNVRIVAATNVDLEKAVEKGRFREDLFYRLNGVMIRIPALRQRRQDIPALFHEFTSRFADVNRISPVLLTEGAKQMLMSYEWPGNVRQLKNVAEQITVLTIDRKVDEKELEKFMPRRNSSTSVMAADDGQQHSYSNEREILFKVLFEMRKDVTDLKKLVVELLNGGAASVSPENAQIIKRLYQGEDGLYDLSPVHRPQQHTHEFTHTASGVELEPVTHVTDIVDGNVQTAEQVYSITDNEKELIQKALVKHGGSRRKAARELGISERTIYRKITNYGIDL